VKQAYFVIIANNAGTLFGKEPIDDFLFFFGSHFYYCV